MDKFPGGPPAVDTNTSRPSTAPPPAASTGIFGFLNGTRLSVLNSFMKFAPSKTAFPHAPGTKSGGLNYPFQPIASQNGRSEEQPSEMRQSSEHIAQCDVDLLDKKITELEGSMNNVLSQEIPEAPKIINPVAFEDFDKLVSSRPGTPTTRRIPANIYHDVIAIYESQLNGNNMSNLTSSKTGSGAAPMADKERNLRKEVLKWNKD